MNVSDNFTMFSNLVNKHLYYMPLGFNEGYDNKLTRYSQIYVIINMFLVDFFKNGIHNNNEILLKLKEFQILFLNIDDVLINLSEEQEIIDFLLKLDPVYNLIREK